MGLAELIKTVTDAITGRRKDPVEYQNVRPASEDPAGDPADEMAAQNIRPASEDPRGDPADQPRNA